jgi:5'-nucleotidase
MARAVPGIDLILGTHSHYKGALETIPGTRTRTIAPYQYLAYVSDVRLTFEAGRLLNVTGKLVPVDQTLPEDPVLAARVAQLERDLRERRPERFARVGRAHVELSDAGLSDGESLLGDWATDVLRRAAGAHAFFSTASSFRAALPPGDVLAEDFYAAIPYPNVIALATLRGSQLREWLALSLARRGTDGFSQQSGLRYVARAGRIDDVQVLADPQDPAKGFVPLDPERGYLVGTTDFQGFFVEGYKQLFAQGADARRTSVDVHATLLEALAAGASARLDGRTRIE